MTRLLSLVLGIGLIGACGGSEPPAREPPKASTPAKDLDQTTAEESPAKQTTNPCEDGSCFSCGESVCPVGFYCEGTTNGAGACGWAPRCAAHLTCACLGPMLKTGPNCSCEERSGGVYVVCSG